MNLNKQLVFPKEFEENYIAEVMNKSQKLNLDNFKEKKKVPSQFRERANTHVFNESNYPFKSGKKSFNAKYYQNDDYLYKRNNRLDSMKV